MACLRAPPRLALCWSRLCFPAWKRDPSSTAAAETAWPCVQSDRSSVMGLVGIRHKMGICTSRLSLLAVPGRGGPGGRDSKDAEDEDADEKVGRKGRKRVTDVSAEDVKSEPMDYFFSGVAPDFKAPRLSDESKERMWKAYADNPTSDMVDKLAESYKIRKQRVHAILWLKDIEKKEAAERGKPLEDDIEKAFEQLHGAYETADNERHVTLPSTMPDFKVQQEGWQGTVKAEGQSVDEVSAKEEMMMVEEFEQRMAFNKMQIANILKKDKSPLSRPVGGWSYLVEELGKEGKRGRRGGRRFVAQPDGSHRGLNELEKMFLKRETVRPRRRLMPK